MKKREYPQIGELMLEERLENGLSVYVFPKPDFEKSFAFFATNYGGMDTRYLWRGQWVETPLGVAHFLEHKMFDTKEGNALQMLTANGASPNAFTSNAITGYYFEATQAFYENLHTLLSFVSEGYFTKESVEKEQGIIGQEIQMIGDNPNWQVYQNLFGALYQHHPIRNSVAGTQESISGITDQTLYQCHQAFYHPRNMVLCVAGNVDAQEVCRIAREVLPKEAGTIIQREQPMEPEQAHEAYREMEMEVAMPLMQLGIKLKPEIGGQEQLRQKLLGELLCEAWVGSSSPLYTKLYTEGLINRGFYYGFRGVEGAACLLMGGESKDPQAVKSAILEEAKRLCREGIDQGLFERLKKAAYGSQVRSLNSFETLCVGQAEGYFAQQDVWLFPEVYATIEKTDLEQALARWVRPEAMALSVVWPKGASR